MSTPAGTMATRYSSFLISRGTPIFMPALLFLGEEGVLVFDLAVLHEAVEPAAQLVVRHPAEHRLGGDELLLPGAAGRRRIDGDAAEDQAEAARGLLDAGNLSRLQAEQRLHDPFRLGERF